MFKNVKLGTKIAFGFGIVLVIAFVLGGLAIVSMTGVRGGAAELSGLRVPEVSVATNVERYALKTVTEMRPFGFNEDNEYFERGMKNLELVKKYLKEATDLAEKNDKMKDLKDNAKKATEKVEVYEKLALETKAIIDEMKKDRIALNEGAAKFMENCYAFLDNQEKKLKDEIKRKTAPDKLLERYSKTKMINDIIDAGNAVRIANFKGQASRDLSIIKEGIKKFDIIDSNLVELLKIVKSEENIKQLGEIKKAGDTYKAGLIEIITNYEKNAEIGKNRQAAANEVVAAAEETSKGGMDITKTIANISAVSLGAASVTMIIGLTAAMIIGIFLAFVIIVSITKPVSRIVSKISEGADQVAAASGQLSSASQKLAEGASEQASALEETSSTLNESASMVQQNTENTKQAAILSEKVKESADKGNSEMKEMSGAMDELKKSSGEISKIIKVIDDIAFQTNILALNAAVEAARAGEAGMGFAVVAEEVRNLAQRSAQAAKDTSAIIEKNISLSERGVSVSKRVADSLGEITIQAKKVNELMDEIAAASQEQTQGIDQINRAVSQMEQVTQGSASTAEESAAASEELSAQAMNMKDVISELTRLVYGSDQKGLAHVSYTQESHNNYSHHEEQPRRIAPQAQSSQYDAKVAGGLKSGRATANRVIPKKSTVVRPEDIIPLEDDTRDF